jgi:hypothetical protein
MSSTFAERSLARALARDREKAERNRKRAMWPGRHFQMAALPPYVELTREQGGWSMRRYQPPRRQA